MEDTALHPTVTARPEYILVICAGGRRWRLPALSLDGSPAARALLDVCYRSAHPPVVHLDPLPEFPRQARLATLRFLGRLDDIRLAVDGELHEDVLDAIFAFLG